MTLWCRTSPGSGPHLDWQRLSIVRDLVEPGFGVGFEARGHGPDGTEAPATVLNSIMSAARPAAGLGIPGLYQ